MTAAGNHTRLSPDCTEDGPKYLVATAADNHTRLSPDCTEDGPKYLDVTAADNHTRLSLPGDGATRPSRLLIQIGADISVDDSVHHDVRADQIYIESLLVSVCGRR